MKNKQKGSALVTILIFTAIGLTVISGAVAIAIINTQGISDMALSEPQYQLAEAGVENAIIQIIRDKNYTGETLTIDDATVVITVTGDTTKTITSESSNGNFTRKIQVIGETTNHKFDLTSWKEID